MWHQRKTLHCQMSLAFKKLKKHYFIDKGLLLKIEIIPVWKWLLLSQLITKDLFTHVYLTPWANLPEHTGQACPSAPGIHTQAQGQRYPWARVRTPIHGGRLPHLMGQAPLTNGWIRENCGLSLICEWIELGFSSDWHCFLAFLPYF